MPCDTIQTTGVELTSPHMASLMKALSDLGLRPRLETAADGTQSIRFSGGSFKNGKLTISSNQTTASEIRSEYAREIGSYAAKQFGFKMQEVAAKTKGAIMAFKLTRNR